MCERFTHNIDPSITTERTHRNVADNSFTHWSQLIQRSSFNWYHVQLPYFGRLSWKLNRICSRPSRKLHQIKSSIPRLSFRKLLACQSLAMGLTECVWFHVRLDQVVLKLRVDAEFIQCVESWLRNATDLYRIGWLSIYLPLIGYNTV